MDAPYRIVATIDSESAHQTTTQQPDHASSAAYDRPEWCRYLKRKAATDLCSMPSFNADAW